MDEFLIGIKIIVFLFIINRVVLLWFCVYSFFNWNNNVVGLCLLKMWIGKGELIEMFIYGCMMVVVFDVDKKCCGKFRW